MVDAHKKDVVVFHLEAEAAFSYQMPVVCTLSRVFLLIFAGCKEGRHHFYGPIPIYRKWNHFCVAGGTNGILNSIIFWFIFFIWNFLEFIIFLRESPNCSTGTKKVNRFLLLQSISLHVNGFSYFSQTIFFGKPES